VTGPPPPEGTAVDEPLPWSHTIGVRRRLVPEAPTTEEAEPSLGGGAAAAEALPPMLAAADAAANSAKVVRVIEILDAGATGSCAVVTVGAVSVTDGWAAGSISSAAMRRNDIFQKNNKRKRYTQRDRLKRLFYSSGNA